MCCFVSYASLTGQGVGLGALTKPAPTQAVRWLHEALEATSDGSTADANDTFSDTPDALHPRGSSSAKPSSLKHRSATGVPAGAVSFVGPCLGEDGVAIGSMFTIADQLSTAAEAALAAALSAFDAAAEEEGKVSCAGQ